MKLPPVSIELTTTDLIPCLLANLSLFASLYCLHVLLILAEWSKSKISSDAWNKIQFKDPLTNSY